MSIQSIEARVEKATKPPWLYLEETGDVTAIIDNLREDVFWGEWRDDNGRFTAHSRQDIPALLAVAKAAKGLYDCPPSPVNGWWDALRDALAELESME